MEPFKQRIRIELSKLNPQYPAGHTWTFWSSPTMKTFLALFGPANYLRLKEADQPMDEETYREAEDAYFAAISECILDTGESTDLAGQPLDLSTPEKARAAFASDAIDVELLGGIITDYTNYLTERYGSLLKKAAAWSGSTVGSSGNGQTAITSPTPS